MMVAITLLVSCGRVSTVFVSIGEFDLADVSSIVRSLEMGGFSQGNDFRIEKEGRSIQVRDDIRYDALRWLAREGVLPYYNHETLPVNITGDYEAHLKVLEARKAELANVILLDTRVIAFRITVPLPIDRLATHDTLSQTSSAVVKFSAGHALTDTDISSIRRLIVNNIPGLRNSELHLTDDAGRPLMSGPDDPP